MNPSHIILQLHSFKMPYLLSICNQFNLPNDNNRKTKIKIKIQILEYLLQDINCGKNTQSLCDNIICKTCYYKSFLSNSKSLYWCEDNINKYGTKITPREVFKSSGNKYWFKCDKCNHHFYIRLSKVTTHNQWCCFCDNKKLCDNNDCITCYNKSFQSSDKVKDWVAEKNIDKLDNLIIPRQVFKSSGNKYWFKCDKCNHEFDISLCNIKLGNWCSFCGNHKLCDNNDCIMCNTKSFQSSDKSNYWIVEKNKDKSDNLITPRQVFKSSGNKYWFKCDKCNHEFDISLNHVNNGKWCCFCDNKKLCDNNDCITCYNKSFASSNKAKYWVSKKNVDNLGIPITPRQVFKSSNNKYWFKCDKCNHNFDMILYYITNGSWCGYCVNQKLCDNNDCITCYNKSFQSSNKCRYWVIKKNKDKSGNPIIPRQVFKSSNNKYWFKCNKCNHEFDTRLSNINIGCWCPHCVNKTETLVLEHLSINYNISHQPKFDWCKNKMNLPFDLLLPDWKLIIEIDGIQHFKVVNHWKTNVKLQQNKDKFKMKCALENGYTIIRLVQEEVFGNKIDWKSRLQQAIKIYDKPQIVFISDIPNIYDNHVFDINDELEYNLIENINEENINKDVIL